MSSERGRGKAEHAAAARPVSSENIFANVRTSGHLFGAIALESGTPLETAPTAEDIDYRSPAPD